MEKRKYDVAALGELLIDFTSSGVSAQGNPLFEANPGGAPCNVLAMLQKLGKKTAFIGKVGDDIFGKMLKEKVCSTGIDISGVLTDRQIHTTLAFVQTFDDGDRDFSFYRNPGADMMLRAEEVNEKLILESSIFHFGSLSMTADGVEAATKKAIEIAIKGGCLLSFDPNYRAPLWESEEKAKEKIAFGLGVCDILKISDNEITLMTGTNNIDKGIAMIREKYNIPIVFATLGKEGSKAYYKDMCVFVKGFENPNTIETTGAGDTFCANALNYILEHNISNWTENNLKELLTFANAAAS